jgi:hypothetical protein
MPEKSFSHKDLVDLLGKLKEETPEYPAKLVDARKESFLKHVLDMGASGGGQGGDGGSDSSEEGPKGGSAGSSEAGGPGKSGKPALPSSPSNSGGSSRPSGLSASGGKGGSGAGLSSGTTFLGFSLKSVLVFGAVVVLLTAAYLFRDQIGEYLADSGITNTEETAEAPFASSQSNQATETPPVVAVPNFEDSSPEIMATPTVPGFESLNNGNSPGTGGNTSPTQRSPDQSIGPATVTPTPGPPGDLGSAMRYLICILRFGRESCQ